MVIPNSAQKVPSPKSPPVIDGCGRTSTIIFDPLSDPMTLGDEPITRIRYPDPLGITEGIIAIIVPAEMEFNVPMLTGFAKLPLKSESCAVNTFPASAGASIVKETFTPVPGHITDGPIGEVVIVVNASGEPAIQLPTFIKQKSSKK